MYQMSRVSRISMSALFSVLLFFIILNPCNLNAQEKTVFDAIQVIPATQAKSAQVQWEKTDIPSPDPRAQEIARKMGQVIRRIKTGSASDPGGRAKPAHLDRYVSRVKSKRPDMEVRFRPISGTPRQIRLKQEDMVRRHINVAKNREGDEDRAGAFLRSVRGLLRIKDPDKELNPESYDSDHLGRRHLRFSQKYRDLPVWPAELIIHLDENGNPDLLNGAIVPTPYRISEKPLISDNDAVEKACASVFGAKAEFAGVPELIIYAPGHRIPRLAWKTELIISPA